MSGIGGDGGDSAVKFKGAGYGNAVGNQRIIDAHSERAGDFQQARNIDGRQVFLTDAGARAYDNFAIAYQATVLPDMVPNDGLFSFLPGAEEMVEHSELEGRKQHHSGSTDD